MPPNGVMSVQGLKLHYWAHSFKCDLLEKDAKAKDEEKEEQEKDQASTI